MFLYPNICVLSWEKVLLPSHIFSVCTRGENFDVFVSGRKRAVARLMQNLQSYSRNQSVQRPVVLSDGTNFAKSYMRIQS